MCSFILVSIHNSISKYYWQNFAKPLAKTFRKTSINSKKDHLILSNSWNLSIYFLNNILFFTLKVMQCEYNQCHISNQVVA